MSSSTPITLPLRSKQIAPIPSSRPSSLPPPTSSFSLHQPPCLPVIVLLPSHSPFYLVPLDLISVFIIFPRHPSLALSIPTTASLHSQPILHPSLHLPPFPSFHPSTIPSHPITTQLEVLIRKGGGAIWCGRPLIETPISLLWTSVCRGSSQSCKNHISISRLFFWSDYFGF